MYCYAFLSKNLMHWLYLKVKNYGGEAICEVSLLLDKYNELEFYSKELNNFFRC